MLRIPGWEVTVFGTASLYIPPRCASCAGPPDLPHAVRHPGRPPLYVPLCRACASKPLAPRRRAIVLGACAAICALALPPLLYLSTPLPQAVLVLVPPAITVIVGLALYFALHPRAQRSPVEVVASSSVRHIFFCAHEGWAREFAQGSGGEVAPALRRDPFREGAIALLPCVGLAMLFSLALWDDHYAKIRVDNAGPTAMQIWLDGQPVMVAPPNEPQDFTSIRVFKGHHVLGHSAVGAAAPEETIAVNITHGNVPAIHSGILYNPGKTACYLLELTEYRRKSGAGSPTPLPIPNTGPLSIYEFYEFDEVDEWFEEPPSEIKLRGSDNRYYRISLWRNEPCVALARRGCSLSVREQLVGCQMVAKSPEALDACVAKAEAACSR